MNNCRPARVLRQFAATFVSGPDSRFILADLEESYARLRGRGVGRLMAGLLFLAAAVQSAWATRHHTNWGPVSSLDLRLALRGLVRQPVLSIVAVVSLMIGVPVGMLPTFIADSVDAVPPFDQPDEVVGIRLLRGETTTFELEALRNFGGSLASVGGFRRVLVNLQTDDVRSGLRGTELSNEALTVLRVTPAVGRTLQPEDFVPGASRVALLGHSTWRSEFGSDEGVVGRLVTIGGHRTEIVGVMPVGFSFPEDQQLWLPLQARAPPSPDGGLPIDLFARIPTELQPSAQAEFEAVIAGLRARYPDRYERTSPEVVPLTRALLHLPADGLTTSLIWRLMRLLALAALAIACLNVALLTYARAIARRAQTAVRYALGASRGRILGQTLAEVLVIALLSVGAGLALLTLLGDQILLRSQGLVGTLPYWIRPEISIRLIGGALVLGLGSAGLAALIPAWRATAVGGLRQRPFGGITAFMIAADVAMATAIAGLAFGTLDRAVEVRGVLDTGPLETENILGFQLVSSTPLGREANLEDRPDAARIDDFLDRLRSEPGVLGVAAGSHLPRMRHSSIRLDRAERRPGDPEGISVYRVRVSPDFLSELGVPVLQGRELEWADTAAAERPVLVNQTFVDLVFAGRAPLGRRIRPSTPAGEEPPDWRTVVGVVPAAGVDIIEPRDDAAFYEPTHPSLVMPLRVGLRVSGDPAGYLPVVREAAGLAGAELVLRTMGPLDTVTPDDWILIVGLAVGLSVAVGVLTALVVSGLYAILTFVVARRRRELGIRLALGAGRGDVISSVTRPVRNSLLIGCALGTPVAVYLYRMILEDPTAELWNAMVGVALSGLVLAVVSGLGAAGPVRAALRVAPSESMRQ